MKASTARAQGDIPHADTLDDASLVARVAAGDRDAFEALYARHMVPLYRTALALTRRSAVAEDLLQETFLRAFRHLERIRLEPGASLRPWLHRILINLVYDRSARLKRASNPLERAMNSLMPQAGASPERRAELAELERDVSQAVEMLPFKQRIVVVLFYLHDMDLSEIAETVGVPVGTVKSRLYYGRANLRSALEQDSRVPTGTVGKPVGHGAT